MRLRLDESNPEPLIRYLEKDEVRISSGRWKEAIWNFLKQVKLTERQKARLCDVAMSYLRKRMQREFFYMCRFICRIADASFWARVEALTSSKDENVSKRAQLLFAYRQGSEAGEQSHREFSRQCLHLKWSSKRTAQLLRSLERRDHGE